MDGFKLKTKVGSRMGEDIMLSKETHDKILTCDIKNWHVKTNYTNYYKFSLTLNEQTETFYVERLVDDDGHGEINIHHRIHLWALLKFCFPLQKALEIFYKTETKDVCYDHVLEEFDLDDTLTDISDEDVETFESFLKSTDFFAKWKETFHEMETLYQFKELIDSLFSEQKKLLDVASEIGKAAFTCSSIQKEELLNHLKRARDDTISVKRRLQMARQN
jgi:hypothetical protein